MIECPSSCPRGLNDCEALSCVSDDEGVGFICCGQNTPESRTVAQDVFRFCFKGEHVDEMGDMDERDMLTQIMVISTALTVAKNDEVNMAHAAPRVMQ